MASELEQVEPESVGFSSERLKKIDEFLQENLDKGWHAGYVSIVARHGKIVHYNSMGQYGIDNAKPMDKDAIFRIFSMTKPVTAVAAMILYEEGAFQLRDPVAMYLPEFAEQKIWRDGELVTPRSAMTIEQLLTNTAGMTDGTTGDHPVETAYQEAKLGESVDSNEYARKAAALPLRYEPGIRYHYSSAGFNLMGIIIERISGQNLDEFFAERIFKPLEMQDTFFNVPEDKIDRVVTNHYWNREEQKLSLLPPQWNPPVNGRTLLQGGGGLFSTAMDYAIFLEMLRNGGSYNGVRILGPKTVQYMMLPRLTQEVRDNGASDYPAAHLYPGQNYGFGGGVTTNPELSQVISSKGEYSWGGIADTKFWIDPEEDLVVVLMAQVFAYPWELRYMMKVATYQALTELGSE
jgi:CubicO group peptidase (beta-lactamase class C family)